MLKSDEILLGTIVSMKSPHYYVGCFNEAIKLDINTFMFYTCNPSSFPKRSITKFKIESIPLVYSDSKAKLDNLLVHATRIINFANAEDPKMLEKSRRMLSREMYRTHAFMVKKLVLELSSRSKTPLEESLTAIADNLNEVISINKTKVMILLENSVGKETYIGSKFENLKEILDKIENKDRVGLCLNLRKAFQSGYDIRKVDEFLDYLDKLIGLDKIKCVMLSDTLKDINSHSYQNTMLGKGTIGIDVFAKYIYNEKLKGVPFILETPSDTNVRNNFKEELKAIKEYKFDN